MHGSVLIENNNVYFAAGRYIKLALDTVEWSRFLFFAVNEKGACTESSGTGPK